MGERRGGRRAAVGLGALLLVLFSSLGCGPSKEDSGTRSAADGLSTAQAGTDETGEHHARAWTPVDAKGASAPSSVQRTHLDLLTHFARAELFDTREGSEALVVDFGEPGSHKYTLGGWRTRTHELSKVDGRSVLMLRGRVARLSVPIREASAHRLELRVRGFGARNVTVYLGEETLADRTLAKDGFQTLSVEVPERLAAVGEHFVQLRVDAVGAAPGGRAGLALDWLRLTPASANASGGVKASKTRHELSLPARTATGLIVPEGARARYPLRVPAQAHLTGRVSEGCLRITALHGEQSAPREVASCAKGAFDLPLGAEAGAFLRLDVQAAAGEGQALVSDLRVTAAGQASAAEAVTKRPKNVLIYLIDTLRADRLQPYTPTTRVRTPGLTDFASQAAVFERGQAPECWTKPSVATLLSGLMPWEHTATSDTAMVPRSVDLLSERLRDKGFFAGAFVANGYVSGKFGFEQGWDSFRNYIREGRRTQARFVAADVLTWLDERPKDKPFFLYVHTIDPHVPYMPPQDLLKSYDPEPYEGPVDFARDRETLEKIKSGRLRLNTRDKRRLQALYDGEITYHDVHMASIFEGLKRRDLADDTLVVITSDHGEEFFDHGSVGHGHSVYQELLHVPFLVRWPGVTDGGQRVSQPVSLADVVPTVLDAVSGESDDALSGRSLRGLLAHAEQDGPRIAVSGFMNGWRAAVVDDYKLIQRTERRAFVYDLKADPGEQEDLSESRPELLRYLRGMLGLSLAGADSGRPHAEAPEKKRPAHEAESAEIDAQTEAQLRALGYVGTSRPQ